MKTNLFFTIYFFANLMFCYGLETIDESSSKYQIIDIGLPEKSYNHPLTITEQGQVVGTTRFDDYSSSDKYLFIWTIESGLEILDLPFVSLGSIKINDLGQIIGEDSGGRIVIWDPNKGVVNLPIILDEYTYIQGFNDAGQILLSTYEEARHGIIFYDDDEPNGFVEGLEFFDGVQFINVIRQLKEQFSDEWTLVSWSGPCAYLNNHGEVLLSCARLYKGQVEKALFLFKDGQFQMIPVSYADAICHFDDEGNALIYSTKYPTGFYLVNVITGNENKIEFTNLNFSDMRIKLQNGKLDDLDHASLELVKQENGAHYYQAGDKIKDLLAVRNPYLADTVEIEDKNTKGWITGTVAQERESNFFFSEKPTSVFVAIPRN
jgi:hypothetical protein